MRALAQAASRRGGARPLPRGRKVLLHAIGACVGAAMLLPDAASACPVCVGDPGSPLAAGVNNGILFLLACVGVVQVGFVALFLSFRNRSRRLAMRRERFSIIEGGVK